MVVQKALCTYNMVFSKKLVKTLSKQNRHTRAQIWCSLSASRSNTDCYLPSSLRSCYYRARYYAGQCALNTTVGSYTKKNQKVSTSKIENLNYWYIFKIQLPKVVIQKFEYFENNKDNLNYYKRFFSIGLSLNGRKFQGSSFNSSILQKCKSR